MLCGLWLIICWYAVVVSFVVCSSVVVCAGGLVVTLNSAKYDSAEDKEIDLYTSRLSM